MSTTTEPPIGERDNRGEKELSQERREQIASFIQDVLQPAKRTIQEEADQIETVKAFESRPYQIEAWDALWRAREEGKDRGLIHLATGLGKTSVAVFDYARFRQEQEAKGETARALFVVHQNAILDQADERFNEVLPHLLPGVGMSRFSNQASALPDGEVVFASFQSLTRGAHKFPPDYFDYIVYDEAHHIEAATYKKVVDHFQPKFQLGLTATPERGDDKDITDHFGEALYTKTLPEGIAEEYLADVHYRLMLDEETKRLLQGGFKPKNMTELNAIFDFEPKPKDVAEAIKLAQQEIREATGLDKVKTIIFSSDIAMADEMAQLTGGESYHSGVGSEKDKMATLEAFRSGDLETIVTRDMFNEGVDIPDARLIVFFRSTQSKTIFEQQLGRGLRKAEGKESVTVLDFVANAERIRLVRELADEVRVVRGSNGKYGSGGEGSTQGGLAISAGKSDFEFDAQIVDILALYDYFVEQREEKIDWREWSDEQIFNLARQLSPDAPLEVSDINKFSKQGVFPSVGYIYRRFNSMPDFQRACGFEPKTDWSMMPDEDIVALALRICPDGPLTSSILGEIDRSLFPSVDVIRSRFGSLLTFQRLCGFEVAEKLDWSGRSDEDIVALAQEVNPDAPMTQRLINTLSVENKFPSLTFIKSRFGSLSSFNSLLGFITKVNVSRWSDRTADEVIAVVQELFPDSTPTASDIRRAQEKDLLPSYTVLRRMFEAEGGYSTENLLKRAGYDIAPKYDWTTISREELIEIAKTISPESPLTGPQARKLDRDTFPPEHVVLQLFNNSWREFIVACGFEANDWSEWSEGQLVSRLLELSPDRPLLSREISAYSKAGKLPSVPYLVKRFGGDKGRLLDVHRACGFDVS